jgi:hypothetical protein
MKSPATSVQGVWVRFINIAAIHGFEESGGRHFLVMELAPGKTLADLSKRIAGLHNLLICVVSRWLPDLQVLVG